jgi:hypothetical protein
MISLSRSRTLPATILPCSQGLKPVVRRFNLSCEKRIGVAVTRCTSSIDLKFEGAMFFRMKSSVKTEVAQNQAITR